MSGFDILILRNGEALSGDVQTKKITIKTSYADLEFKKKNIIHIHFENLPQFPRDEVYLKTMDKVKGKLSDTTVSFKIAANSQVVDIDCEKIHTIMFLDNV